MKTKYCAALFLILFSFPAHAYLVPLAGVGGVIATALAGFIAVIFSAFYLIWYKLRRLLRRGRNQAARSQEDDALPPPS